MGRSKNRKRSQAADQRMLRWCFHPRRLMIAAALSLVAVFWPQFRRQIPELEARPEYQIGLDRITVTPPPRWIPEDLVEDVFHRVDISTPLSLQDEDLSERIAAAFVTHPWIQKVHRVSKSFPARVHVEVTYRTPVAIVRGVDGHYPLDASGTLLPGGDFSRSDIDRYPIIDNVTSVPQAGPGESWGDPAVFGAAQLAAVLLQPLDSGRSRWESWGLGAIEAPSVVGLPDEVHELQYRIRTRGGSDIIWGRAPGTDHPGEFSAEQKLQRMAEYHTVQGSFDDSPGAWIFDLREWKGILRERKSAQRDIAREPRTSASQR